MDEMDCESPSNGAEKAMNDESDEWPMEDGEPQRRLTWTQIRELVNKSKKRLTQQANRTPLFFQFRQHDAIANQNRLYFLGVPPLFVRMNTIVAVDVHRRESQLDNQVLPIECPEWNVLVQSFQMNSPVGYSKEEQLLRERKRMSAFGITSFDLHQASGRFVFNTSAGLFTCIDDMQGLIILADRVATGCSGARLDAKICPKNPELIAFIHQNDIWVTHLQSGDEKRLTWAHKGDCPIGDDPRTAGVASYIIQEEFDRFTGYWWQPTCTTDDNQRVIYRILYEEVDESNVEIFHIVSYANVESAVDEYRYPRTGSLNAKSYARVLEFTVDASGKIDNVKHLCLRESAYSVFDWSEYLVRLSWTVDGAGVWLQLVNRHQTQTAIIYAALDCFTTSSETATAVPPVHVLYEETSDIWINVSEIMEFLPETRPKTFTFLTSSERTGHRHIYRVSATMTDIAPLPEGDPVRVAKRSEEALTGGEWDVANQAASVDSARQLIYFTGYKDTPLESHLYIISMQGGEPHRLTELNYSHSVTMNADCSLFVDIYSNISSPVNTRVFQILHAERRVLPVCDLFSKIDSSDGYLTPEIFDFKSKSGWTLYGMLYRPPGWQPTDARKYPTVLFVYGGPHVQKVSNSYKGVRELRLETMARMGFCVLSIDNRGSMNRGLLFEGHLKHKLGVIEIEDQVEGLLAAAERFGCIDLDRVAIHGWSYGGYLSLMGIANRPDVFRASIAGAPVTHWQLYDTGYTERYLGLPQENPDGYRESSVIEYANLFPDEDDRLLIIHGLIDENVHFCHTQQLLNALVKQCKPYRFQAYPSERHSMRSFEASEHYEITVLQFLQDHVKLAPPRPAPPSTPTMGSSP